jgi:cyclopropane fatty-acyl-phospholipid synthase-like methyltransferase
MIHPEASSNDREAVQYFFTGTVMDYSKLFLSRRSGSNFSFRERLTLAVQMTTDITGRLLDCACGTGEITTVILGSGRFTSATVVDLSPRMLEAAQQRMEIELKELRIGRLEFKSSDIFEFATQPHAEKYDLILCLGLIAHTGRLDDLLVKLKTLLSSNGRILLQSSLLDHVGTKFVRLLTHVRYYRQHGYRISYFHHQDIVRAAQNAGLKAVVVRRYTFGFPFGDRLWAGMNYRIEQRMQHWAKLHGAEAMYLLQHNSREH